MKLIPKRYVISTFEANVQLLAKFSMNDIYIFGSRKNPQIRNSLIRNYRKHQIFETIEPEFLQFLISAGLQQMLAK